LVFIASALAKLLNKSEFSTFNGKKQSLSVAEADGIGDLPQSQFSITPTMARVTTYLNFARSTEEAFNFYKSVFGTEFSSRGIMRFGDMPPMEGAPAMPDDVKNLILHVELPIFGGHVLMGSDAPESMGMSVTMGTNIQLNLEPDTRAETTRLFNALSAGGKVTQPLEVMFWGSFYGTCTDRFGVQWMVNCHEQA
jgi:PhnB protein